MISIFYARYICSFRSLNHSFLTCYPESVFLFVIFYEIIVVSSLSEILSLLHFLPTYDPEKGPHLNVHVIT